MPVNVLYVVIREENTPQHRDAVIYCPLNFMADYKHLHTVSYVTKV